MLIIALFTDESLLLNRSSILALSQRSGTLCPPLSSPSGGLQMQRANVSDFLSPGFWPLPLLPGGAMLAAVTGTYYVAHIWSGILAGSTRAELLYPLVHLPIKNVLCIYIIPFCILTCFYVQSHRLEQERAKSSFGIFKWLENIPKENNILWHVKIMCP